VAKFQAPAYSGAVIINAKALYEDKSVRKIMVTYTPADDSCLADKEYTMKIILTTD
jgi:hypothetical protein